MFICVCVCDSYGEIDTIVNYKGDKYAYVVFVYNNLNLIRPHQFVGGHIDLPLA